MDYPTNAERAAAEKRPKIPNENKEPALRKRMLVWEMEAADMKPSEPKFFNCGLCGIKVGRLYMEAQGGVCPDCYEYRVNKKFQNFKQNVLYWTVPLFIILTVLFIFLRVSYAMAVISNLIIIYSVHTLIFKRAMTAISKISRKKLIGLVYMLYIFATVAFILGLMYASLFRPIISIILLPIFLISINIIQYLRFYKELKMLPLFRAAQSRYLIKQEEYEIKLKAYDEAHKHEYFSDVDEGAGKVFFDNLDEDEKFVSAGAETEEFQIEEPVNPEEIVPAAKAG